MKPEMQEKAAPTTVSLNARFLSVSAEPCGAQLDFLSTMYDAARSGAEFPVVTASILADGIHAAAIPQLKRVVDAVLASEKPSVGLSLLLESGAFSTFPLLQGLQDVPQDPLWHPEGNVWKHTLLTLDEGAAILRMNVFALPEDARSGVMWGLLLHDNGKLTTTYRRETDQRLIAPGHEKAGVESAESFLTTFGLPKHISDIAVAIVERHMAPPALMQNLEQGLMNDISFDRAVNRLRNRLPEGGFEPLLIAAMADRLGRGTPPTTTARDKFVKAFLEPFHSKFQHA